MSQQKTMQLLQETLSHIKTLMKSNVDTTNTLLERTKIHDKEIETLFDSFRKQLNDRETLLRNILHTEANNQLNKLKDEESKMKQYEIAINQTVEEHNNIMIDTDINYKQIVYDAINRINFDSMRIQYTPITFQFDTDSVTQVISNIGNMSDYDCKQIQMSTNAPKQISFIVIFAWTKKRILLKNNTSKRQFEYTIYALKQQLLKKYANKLLKEPFMLVRDDGQIIQTDSDILKYLYNYKGETKIHLSKHLFLIKVCYIHDHNGENSSKCIVFNKNVSFKEFKYEIMNKLNIFDRIKMCSDEINEENLLLGYQSLTKHVNIITINVNNFNVVLPKQSNPIKEIIVWVGFEPKIPKIKLMKYNLLNQIEIELCETQLINDFTLEVKHCDINMFTKSFSITMNELNANNRYKLRVMGSNIFGKSHWSKWKLYKPPKELDMLVVYGYFRKYKHKLIEINSNMIIEICLLFMFYHRLMPYVTPFASKTKIISMILTYNDIRKRIVLKKYNEFCIKALKQRCIEKYKKQNLKQPFDLVTEIGQRIENDKDIILHLNECKGDIRIIKSSTNKSTNKSTIMTPIAPSDEQPIVEGKTPKLPKNYRKLISIITLFNGYKKRVVLRNNPTIKQYQYTMRFLKQKCINKFKDRGLKEPFALKLNNGNTIKYDNDIINNLIGYTGIVKIVKQL
eukprot:372464_1